MKPILFYVLALISFTAFSQSKGQKIAYLDNGSYVFTADTTGIKKGWEKLSPLKNTSLSNIQIQQGTTFNERQETFYMLIAYDNKANLKMSRYIIRDKNDFYFAAMDDTFSDGSLFYVTVFECHGSKDNCSPRVAIIDGEYVWTPNEILQCHANDPCKASTSVTFLE